MYVYILYISNIYTWKDINQIKPVPNTPAPAPAPVNTNGRSNISEVSTVNTPKVSHNANIVNMAAKT